MNDNGARTGLLLERLLRALDAADTLEDSGEVHVLSVTASTASVTIDGVSYSLTLNRED